jgi:hypothetical protein
MRRLMEADCLLCEPADIYHARAAEYLSSHQLADFRKCPRLYRDKQLGLVPDEDRPAYRLGRAAHTLILEGGDRFEACYAVGGPVNPSTGQPYGTRTKAYAEWAASLDKEVLTDDEAALCARMDAGVAASEIAGDLLAEGVAEGVARADYCGIACQARFDWVNPCRGLVDLKTCDDLTWLEADARRYGYAYQLAFYRAVLARVCETVLPVYMVGVEKKPPHRCGVWRLGEDVLALAQRENEEAIARLVRCREADTWPTGYEDLRTFDYL